VLEFRAENAESRYLARETSANLACATSIARTS
jgi:hypothetical protein